MVSRDGRRLLGAFSREGSFRAKEMRMGPCDLVAAVSAYSGPEGSVPRNAKKIGDGCGRGKPFFV